MLDEVAIHCVERVGIWSFFGGYAVQSRENTDQKNSQYRHFSCSGKLKKFIGNSRDVLTIIPEERHHQKIKDQDVNIGNLPIEPALGVHWNFENDYLGFKVNLKDKPLTRRGMVPTISSVYDLLGVAAPLFLGGWKILQKLCQLIGWYEKVIGFFSEINDRNWKTLKWTGPKGQIIFVMSWKLKFITFSMQVKKVMPNVYISASSTNLELSSIFFW